MGDCRYPNRGFDGHISACPLLKSSRTLAPAKIDKPKIAEILPFSADSDTYSHLKEHIDIERM